MVTVEVRYLVDNFSVDNDVQVSALFEDFDASAARVCGSTIVALSVEVPNGADALNAIRSETTRLERTVDLRAIDVDLDLVDEGEIAARLAKSRQSINLIARGQRGQSFPTPFALPGGRRLWTWAAVARWVRRHRPDWDDEAEPDHLSREQQRELAAWLTSRYSKIDLSHVHASVSLAAATHLSPIYGWTPSSKEDAWLPVDAPMHGLLATR